MYALYVTHPQVMMDPVVPVPRWGLSSVGTARARAFSAHPLLTGITRIVSSDERKAVELAGILAEASGAPVSVDVDCGENDRSSTGFVPPDRFEELANAFFAHPDQSMEGWETARHAQQRIVAAFERAVATHDLATPLVFTGHGAVGTLLKCHLAGRAISRDEDQRRIGDPGGGNVFAVRLRDRKLLCDWTAMEQLPAALQDG
jgi:broad specificity phosphatase PhoE